MHNTYACEGQKKASHPTYLYSLKTKWEEEKKNKKQTNKKNGFKTNITTLFPLGFFSASMKLECNYRRAISAARLLSSVSSVSYVKATEFRFTFNFWFVFHWIKRAS